MPPRLLHVPACHLSARHMPSNLSASPFPQCGWGCGTQPGFGMSMGQRRLCKAAAAPALVPLCCGLGFLNEGWPGPQHRCSTWVSQCILVSAYKKRWRGGLRWGGIPVNGLQAFLILENRKLHDFSTGFRFLRGEARGQTAPLDHCCDAARDQNAREGKNSSVRLLHVLGAKISFFFFLGKQSRGITTPTC